MDGSTNEPLSRKRGDSEIIDWCYENLPACVLPYCFAQHSAKTMHSIRPRQMYARGDAGIVFPV